MIKQKEELDQFVITNWNKISDYLDQEAKDISIPFTTA